MLSKIKKFFGLQNADEKAFEYKELLKAYKEVNEFIEGYVKALNEDESENKETD